MYLYFRDAYIMCTGKQDTNTEEEQHFCALWSEDTVKVILFSS